MQSARCEVEAQRARKKPFPIWDFSGYNSITTEELPAIDEPTQTMKWYAESSHYSKNACVLILNRMFNPTITGKDAPNDFGVIITTENIEGHLGLIRASRKQYVETHAEDVSEIRELIKKLNKIWLRTD